MKAKPSIKAETPPAARTGNGTLEETLTNDSLRHLRIGWWSLLIYLTLGIILEALHGFKVGFYLNVSNETRRLMWTLAHAHGTLISLVQIAFALTLRLVPLWNARQRALAGRFLIASNLLLPGGFFLGGWFLHGGDPGLGVLLVPLGAILLLASVLLTARAFNHK